MLWTKAAIGTVALLGATASMASTEAETSTETEHEVLDLDRERYERYTVPITIGESRPYRFMIDTGAQATVIGSHIADELTLGERGTATLVGMASRKPIEIVSVQDLNLGERSFDIHRAPLVPRENIGVADGILGLDSLQDQRVLLDFSEKTISVADAETLGGNGGYDIIVRARQELGQLIIARARIDGVRVNVIVDTGAQGSIGNLALQEKLRTRNAGDTKLTDINGTQITTDMRVAKKLQIGRARLSNFMITFIDSPTFEALGLDDEPAMVLGMRELQLFKRVAIDFRERRVLFDLPRNRDWNSEIGGSHFTFQ
jgi:predicted aspartyl protease